MSFRLYKAFFRKALYYFEKRRELYLRIQARGKFFDETTKTLYSIYDDINTDFGILLQGQLIKTDNFTLETVRLYKYIYPNAIIVVSTSEEEDMTIAKQIESIGVPVITYAVPQHKGIANINMQIQSTVTGLNYLKDKGVKYALKTRTDQRCSKPVDFLSYMKNLQMIFPVTDPLLKKRLIIASTNSFSLRLYPITDMFMFGHIADMELYWNVPLHTAVEYDKNPDWVTFMKYNVAEGYLVNHFFKNVNFSPDWTAEDSDLFLSKYFCIIDQEQIDLYWLKYERFFDIPYEFLNPLYKQRTRKEFAMWVSAWSKYNNC